MAAGGGASNIRLKPNPLWKSSCGFSRRGGVRRSHESVALPSAICGDSRFIRENSRCSSFFNANGRKPAARVPPLHRCLRCAPATRCACSTAPPPTVNRLRPTPHIASPGWTSRARSGGGGRRKAERSKPRDSMHHQIPKAFKAAMRLSRPGNEK
jgi:hypothetical protein